METAAWLRDDERLWLAHRGVSFEIVDTTRAPSARHAGRRRRQLRASMNGRVVAVAVALGQRVAAGDPVMTLEAMKMEHVHAAPIAGTVKALHVAAGDQVAAHACWPRSTTQRISLPRVQAPRPPESSAATQGDRPMSDTAAAVLHDKRGHAFWITINRPDKRNAINADVIAGIRAGYRAAHADADVRVIVLTGAGEKAFCAGADLQPGKGFAFDPAKPNLDYADLMRDAHNATLPSIARINGVCMAGGMGLLCMTDMAVAADHVQFGLPEVKVGVFPMQVMSLLQQIAPRRRVREWALSGEPFDAAQALQAGL